MSESEKLKASARRAAKEVLMPVKASFFLFCSDGEEDDDECKNTLIDALMEELRAMRPGGVQEKKPAESCTCGSCERGAVGLDFGEAIRAVKRGARIGRKGWNGKGQYIELATCVSYKNTDGDVVNAEHAAMGNAALAFVGTSGVQLGWLASQADMLAEDWWILEPAREETE